MTQKIITLIVVRIIELLVLSYTTQWLWVNVTPGYELYVVCMVVVAYLVYLAVTLSNDAHDLKYGDIEPRM